MPASLFANCYHVFVNVISRRGLDEAAKALNVDRDTAAELTMWFHEARKANWTHLSEVRMDFPSVDQIGHVLVFNIRHNRYRLIVRVTFPKQKLYVKELLTHTQYDREEWKQWV
jgi:mRNA interferase HigB